MNDDAGLKDDLDAVGVHDAQAARFDRWYETLAENPYAGAFVYGRMKIEALLEETIRVMPVESRALDVGCGTGFNLSRMRDRGFDVVGIEPATGMRQRAIARNPGVDVIDGNIESLPFEDASFDLVISVEVLRYLSDPSIGIREISRVLRPGGLAILTAAPRWSLNGYAFVNLVTSRLSIPTFTKLKQSFLPVRSGRSMMKQAGFRQIEVHGLFFGPWVALGRVSPSTLATGLRAWERFDDWLSGWAPLRDLSNHLVFIARK